jgi:ABC-type cobalamin transport system ATPase subunit
MPRRTTRKNDVRDNNNLALRESESVEFPVAKNHPYARFQSMRRVQSVEDISQFLQLWNEIADIKREPRPQPKKVLAELIQEKVSVMRIAPANLHLPKGSVLVLNNPLNEVEVANASILGDLISRGELCLKCNILSV